MEIIRNVGHVFLYTSTKGWRILTSDYKLLVVFRLSATLNPVETFASLEPSSLSGFLIPLEGVPERRLESRPGTLTVVG